MAQSWNLSANLFGFSDKESDGEVLFYKIFEVFIVWGTIYLAWMWGEYILRISDVVLPLGLAIYVDVSFMFGNSLPLINAGLISALVVLGFFRVTRYAYLVAFFLLHLQYAARFTLGEIPHSANMFGMIVLGIGLAMVLFHKPAYQRRFTIGFTYFFLGLGYTLAAFSKLIGTGITWSDGRHLWMWVNEKGIDAFAKSGVLEFNALQELILSEHWIATAFLTIGLLSEFVAFGVWWRRFRMLVMLAIFALHTGIYFVMNILFILSMYELVLLAFPWAVWLDWVLARSAGERVLRPLVSFSHRFA